MGSQFEISVVENFKFDLSFIKQYFSVEASLRNQTGAFGFRKFMLTFFPPPFWLFETKCGWQHQQIYAKILWPTVICIERRDDVCAKRSGSFTEHHFHLKVQSALKIQQTPTNTKPGSILFGI